jgi:MoxR-like ATPase/HEAT repeat protein/Mg-chelatase subunit ChlD
MRKKEPADKKSQDNQETAPKKQTAELSKKYINTAGTLAGRNGLLLEPLLKRMNTLIEILSTGLGGDVDLKIIPGDWWAYDFENNSVTFPLEDLIFYTPDKVVGYILHEMGHHQISRVDKREDIFALFLSTQYLQLLLNAFEDARCNNWMLDHFKGSRYYLEQIYDELLPEDLRASAYTQKLEREIRQDPTTPLHPYQLYPHLEYLLSVLYYWRYNRRPQEIINSNVVDALNKTAPYFNAIFSAYPRDTESEADKRHFAKECALKIWRCIVPEYEKLVNESMRNVSQTLESGQLPTVNGEYAPEMSTDDLNQEARRLVEKASEELAEHLTSKIDQPEEIDISDQKESGELHEDRGTGAQVDQEESEKTLVTLIQKRRNIQFDEEHVTGEYQRTHGKTARLLQALVGVLENVLSKNRRPTYEGFYMSGQKPDIRKVMNVSRKAQQHIPLTKRDMHVFLKRRRPTKREHRIVLVIDESSSMREPKRTPALTGLLLFAEALDYLAIDYAVIGFAETPIIHKRFGKNLTQQERESLFASVATRMAHGTTADADALALATRLLEVEPENALRLIIMISDGEGNVNTTGKTFQELQNIAEKQNIPVIGIGLGQEITVLQKRYNRSIHVPAVEKLPKILGGVIEKSVIATSFFNVLKDKPPTPKKVREKNTASSMSSVELLLAKIYTKLKQEYPDTFSLRDLKRAAEVLSLLSQLKLTQKDVFIETCNYAFLQAQEENLDIIDSIVLLQDEIKEVFRDFIPSDLSLQPLSLSTVISSIPENLDSFLNALIKYTESSDIAATLSFVHSLNASSDVQSQITGKKIAYNVLTNVAIRRVVQEELELGLTDRAWATRQLTAETLVDVYSELIVRKNTELTGLEKLLEDRAWAVRKAAVTALGAIYPQMIHHGKAVNLAMIQQMLVDRDYDVRQTVIEALQAIYLALINEGQNVNISLLEQCLDDKEEAVRQAAMNALGGLYAELIKQGRSVELALVERGLSSEYLAVRRSAAKALGIIYAEFVKQGKDIDLKVVEQGLTGLIDYVRQAAIEAIGTIYPQLVKYGKDIDLEQLEQGLQDEYWAIRQATVAALGSIYTALVEKSKVYRITQLEGALSDPAWAVRATTAKALAKIYPEFIRQGLSFDMTILDRAATDIEPAVREAAIDALGLVSLASIQHNKDVDVTRVKRGLEDKEEGVRRAALDALGRIYAELINQGKDVDVSFLDKGLIEGSVALRRTAIKALGTIDRQLINRNVNVDVVKVEKALTDESEEVRLQATEMLGLLYCDLTRLGTRVDLAKVERLLRDDSWRIQRVALQGAEQLIYTILREKDAKDFTRILRIIDDELNKPLTAPLQGTHASNVKLSENTLCVGFLMLQRDTAQTELPPCIITQSSFDMFLIISLAYLLDHPLLLLGPTSTGKSFLIKWLAEALGRAHLSYTLNPYVSKSELIGGVKPTKQGKFSWQDGVILKAAKGGNWLVLEEINLASSEVLEILNDYLITGTFMYSEDGKQKVVEPHPCFRLFATANPISYAQRERLSQVFFSRFKVYYQKELTEDELSEVVSSLYDIPADLAYKLSFFHTTVQKQAASKIIGREEKEPHIFSLRDLIRLGKRLQILIHQNLAEKEFYAHLYLELYDIYVARIRDKSEREALIKLLDTVFNFNSMGLDFDQLLRERARKSVKLLNKLTVTKGSQFVPDTVADITPTPSQECILVTIVKALLAHEPVLLVGYPASGKTTLVRYLARKRQTDLYYINLSSDSGIEELLGGYLQDTKGKWYYKHGLLFEAVQNGSWLLIDEANLNPLSEYLNTLIDFGYIVDEEGKVYRAHKNFRLLFSINPPKIHPSRNILSPALRTRFNEIWVEEVSDIDELSKLVSDWIRTDKAG